MPNLKIQNPLPEDPAGNKIFSASKIVAIHEVSITAAAFADVTLPANTSCKTMYLTTRDGADFLLSVDDTKYSTLPSGIAIDLAALAGDTPFAVKGSSSTTLEVMLLD